MPIASRVDAVDPLAFLGGEARHEVAHQLRHVLEPLAQRRHPDREDVQPVVEVLAEAAFADQADQIPVGRRDQPEVDLDLVLAADRIDLAVLQGAQQLHLGVERQLADLVEEQRAAIGFEEFADALLDGAGEGAFLVAEQDALDQILRDGAAIDGDEGLGSAGAFALDGARDQLLADARFAFDQHRDGGVGGPVAELDHALHGIAAGDQVVEAKLAAGGGLHADQLAVQRLDLERVLDGDFEPLGTHRLDHEVDGAGAHRRDGGVDAAMSGLHDDRRLAGQRAHGGENGYAVGARHDEVEQDKADLPRVVGLERFERLIAAIRRGDAVAEPLDGLFENTTLSRVVIDDQYALRHDAGLATLRYNPHDGGQRASNMCPVEARCSCAKIVQSKGKHPLYRSTILVKLWSCGPRKGPKHVVDGPCRAASALPH